MYWIVEVSFALYMHDIFVNNKIKTETTQQCGSRESMEERGRAQPGKEAEDYAWSLDLHTSVSGD
jgi:hypothetical protein